MKNFDLTKLHNAEHLALMTDVVKLLEEANIEVLSELKTGLKVKVTVSEEAQKQIRKSEHTNDLVVLDEKRDRLYRGLVLRLQSEELAEEEGRREAARKVFLVINTYGNFTKYNYRKETVEISNMIVDLKSETYFSAVKQAGVEEWVLWLDNANKAFETLYDLRRDSYAELPDVDMKNIRKETDSLFKKLGETIRALEILQPSEALEKLVSKINATLDKWKEVLGQRNAKKGKKDDGQVLGE